MGIPMLMPMGRSSAACLPQKVEDVTNVAQVPIPFPRRTHHKGAGPLCEGTFATDVIQVPIEHPVF